jgi:hypothetical protein
MLASLPGRRPLRRELAGDDVERGDHRERDADGDAVRGRGSEAAQRPFQRRHEEVSEDGLTDPAQRERGHGDAELTRGNVGVEVLDDVGRAAGGGGALAGELLESRAPGRHDRGLRGDEEAVREDEHDDGAESYAGGEIRRPISGPQDWAVKPRREPLGPFDEHEIAPRVGVVLAGLVDDLT